MWGCGGNRQQDEIVWRERSVKGDKGHWSINSPLHGRYHFHPSQRGKTRTTVTSTISTPLLASVEWYDLPGWLVDDTPQQARQHTHNLSRYIIHTLTYMYIHEQAGRNVEWTLNITAPSITSLVMVLLSQWCSPIFKVDAGSRGKNKGHAAEC